MLKKIKVSYIDSFGSSNGQVLTANGNTVYWANSSGGFTNGQSISVNNFVVTGFVSANGSNGTSGQVLTSNGTSAYWSTLSFSVNTDAQFVWTNTHTFSQTINATSNNALYLGGTLANGYQTTAGLSANIATLAANSATYVLANSGIVSNASGVFVNSAYIATLAANSTTYVLANTGIVSNASGVFVNSAYIATLTANNANNLNGVAAASYVQNTDSRTLSGNLYLTGANTTFSGNLTIQSTGELIITNGAGIYANGSLGTSGQVLTSNGTTVYWSTVSGGGGAANADASYSWTNTHVFTNNTASGNNNSGAVKIVGGLGVTGAVYTGSRVGFANTSNVSVAYFQYNAITNSVDLVFG